MITAAPLTKDTIQVTGTENPNEAQNIPAAMEKYDPAGENTPVTIAVV